MLGVARGYRARARRVILTGLMFSYRFERDRWFESLR